MVPFGHQEQCVTASNGVLLDKGNHGRCRLPIPGKRAVKVVHGVRAARILSQSQEAINGIRGKAALMAVAWRQTWTMNALKLATQRKEKEAHHANLKSNSKGWTGTVHNLLAD